MKILHVVANVDLAAGGVAQGVISITSFYRELGVEPWILSIEQGSDITNKELHYKPVSLGKRSIGKFS